MKTYFKLIYKYHKQNTVLYILLLMLISIRYILKIPTPLGMVLKPLKIKYWSEGLTSAAVQILKLNFTKAYKYNPLIFVIIIILIFFVFLIPIFEKHKNI